MNPYDMQNNNIKDSQDKCKTVEIYNIVEIKYKIETFHYCTIPSTKQNIILPFFELSIFLDYKDDLIYMMQIIIKKIWEKKYKRVYLGVVILHP